MCAKGPGARALAQRWEGLRGRDEGQIGLLVLGMTIIAILLILTTAAITAVSLARMRLLDAADSAALVAANAFEDATYATTGVGSAVPVSDASVQRAAADHLATCRHRTALPSGVCLRGPAHRMAKRPSWS